MVPPLDLDALRQQPPIRHNDGTIWVEIPKLARDWLCDQAEQNDGLYEATLIVGRERDALSTALAALADDFSDAVDRCAEIDTHADESVQFWRERISEASALAAVPPPPKAET